MAETRRDAGTQAGPAAGCAVGMLSLAVALLIAEMATRWLYPVPLHATDTFLAAGPQELREGRARPRWLRPNCEARHVEDDFDVAVSTNSHGLRDEEIAFDKPDGHTRVLAVGDSFTFGYGVEVYEAFCKVAQRNLGGDTLVINCGVPSWGTADELDFLLLEGFDYAPDAVVVCVYENDVRDNLNRGTYRVTASGVERTAALGSARQSDEGAGGLHTQDPFCEQVLDRGASTWGEPEDAEPSFLVRSSNLWRIARQALSRATQRGRAAQAATTPAEQRELGRRLTVGLLAEIARACGERGVPVIVMLMPSKEDVQAGATERFTEEIGALAGEAGREGAEIVDLMPVLLAHGGRTLYFPTNRHINADGHRVVGEALARSLEELLVGTGGRR